LVEGKYQVDLMSATEKWKDDLYNEVFQSRMEFLRKRRENDSSFDMKTMDEILADEYKKQELAWAGKSPIQEITEAATIAAYEHFKAEWKED
jgi:hypothetical protein